MTSRWPLVRLGEVLRQDLRYIDQPEPRMYRKLSVRLYGKGVVLDTPADGSALRMKRHQLAHAGQVVLSEIWGKKGAIGFVPPEGEGALCTSHFFLFDVGREKLERGWLAAIFRANYLEEQLGTDARGTTGYAAVRPKHLLAAEIPLPPLEEQRRIVAKLNALSGKVAEGEALRRQAVSESRALAGAMAHLLFARLSNHQPIGTVAEIRGGIQKGPHRAPGAHPVRYLTVAHVQRNRILIDDPRYFEVTPEELWRWRLLPGDVLIIEGNGSAEQIGRTALFGGEIADCVHQNHVIRIRPGSEVLLPEFLNSFLNSPSGQEAVQAQGRTTSGLRTLSVGRISKIEVPVPPLEEQREVIARLRAAEPALSTLSRYQAGVSSALAAVMPSLLDRAFRGEF